MIPRTLLGVSASRRRPLALPVVLDDNIDKVAVLLRGNGANNSTAVADSSLYGAAFVASGAAKISTVSSKFGGSSLYFDGSGGTQVGNTNKLPQFQFGTGDFTIEFWLNLAVAVSGNAPTIIDLRLDGDPPNNQMPVLYCPSAGTLSYHVAGDRISGAMPNVPGQWMHIAVSRVSGNTRLFIDGTQIGTTYPDTGNYTSNVLRIGSNYIYNSTVDGYIDDFRLTVGLGRYTANFTPPTAEFSDAALGTNDPYFAAVVGLLHFNGANAATTTTDSSSLASPVTLNGPLISTAQSKFGGSSLLLSGAAQWAQLAYLERFRFRTGDFTLECFVKTASASRVQALIDFFQVGQNGWQMYINTDGSLAFYESNPNTTLLTGGAVLTDNAWHHVAVTRAGTTLRAFVDGVLQSTATSSKDHSGVMPFLGIGAQVSQRNASYDFIGNIDDVRLTKGVARYTANFTAPSTQFPDLTTGSAHRYWSMKINAISGSECAVHTLLMATTVGGANIARAALGAAYIGTVGSYGGSYGPQSAFDDDAVSVYDPGSQSVGAYFGMDFGTPVSIAEYGIGCTNPAFVPTAWDFRYSDDGVNWTVVDGRSGQSFPTTAISKFAISGTGLAAAWNPTDKGSAVVLSNGNLTATSSQEQSVRATVGKASGKWYWEILVGAQDSEPYGMAGVMRATDSVSLDPGTYAWRSGGTYPFATGDVLGFALDMGTRAFSLYINNVFKQTLTLPAGSVEWFPAVGDDYGDTRTYTFTGRFNASSQQYSPPSGYVAIGG